MMPLGGSEILRRNFQNGKNGSRTALPYGKVNRRYETSKSTLFFE